MLFPPVQYIPGPLGVYGLQLQPSRHDLAVSAASLPPRPPETAEEPKEGKEKEGEKKPEKKDEKAGEKLEKKGAKPKPKPKSSPMGPPSLAPGVSYMFPTSHAYMHVFQKSVKIWEPKYQGRKDLYVFRIPSMPQ